jgi:hypothetical protein
LQTASVQGAALQGIVHGGQNPISGASVYLYAANTTGYAGPGVAASSSNASVSLLTSAGNTTKDANGNYYVTTGSLGGFTISGDYTCPSASAQVYLYAVGGNPGLAAGTNNTAAGMIAGLGSCGSLTTSTFAYIDEVSTIATAYALAGFATDSLHISSSGSTLAQTGIANAFASIANLETLSTGLALATTPALNGAVPQTEINTLANILAACVNTTGPSSSACTTLLGTALAGGTSGTAPTDVTTAAINIAHNPWANTSTLYGLQVAGAPFQGTLGGAPNDWTVIVNYTGGGLSAPWYLAIDKSGNVWVTSEGNSTIDEFSTVGKAYSSLTGFSGGGINSPRGLAIDTSGNVWVANNATGSTSISEFNSSGAAVSGSSGISGGGLNAPWGIAIDSSGNVWAANFGSGTVSEYNPSGGGSWLSPSSGFGSSANDTNAMAIATDLSGHVWVTTQNKLLILNSSSGAVAGNFSGGGLSDPQGIATDASGNAWAANTGNSTLSEFVIASDSWNSGSPFSGGGSANNTNVAVDGSGKIWSTDGNSNFSSISEFTASGTAVTNSGGYVGVGGLAGPEGLAIDGSGNVWAANNNTNSISELVGAASPVVTPIVANLITPYGSADVNKP